MGGVLFAERRCSKRKGLESLVNMYNLAAGRLDGSVSYMDEKIAADYSKMYMLLKC